MRVLIAEPLAESGIAPLRAAGFDVDARSGLTQEELLEAVQGAHALVIRSATQVTDAVLEAGSDLVVVGRAGIGLDNVDVQSATARGVMVVNAPQSNVVSAAEQTMALLLAVARNTPQAHLDLTAGKWNRSKWEGVELQNKVLGIVGLGRVGVLVAQRCLAFGMRLLAYDPFVAPERARQLGVRLVDTVEELIPQCDFLTIHLPKNAETVNLINADRLRLAQPHLRLVNTARGGIVNENDLADAIRNGVIAGAGLDVFEKEPTTESPLFSLPSVVVCPHLGASTVEAQDRAGETIAEQVILALRGDFVPFAVNLAASEAASTVRPFLPLAEQLGRVLSGLAGEHIQELDISYGGTIAGYDCGVLTLSVLKGLLSPRVDEPVSYVNAPAIAKRLGVNVSTITAPSPDFSSLVTLRTVVDGVASEVAGTLVGEKELPRIVGVNGHLVDVAPHSHLLAVANDDRPGMIGIVGTALGAAGVNISDMTVGRDDSTNTALMVVSVGDAIASSVIAELEAQPGILWVRSIDLD